MNFLNFSTHTIFLSVLVIFTTIMLITTVNTVTNFFSGPYMYSTIFSNHLKLIVNCLIHDYHKMQSIISKNNIPIKRLLEIIAINRIETARLTHRRWARDTWHRGPHNPTAEIARFTPQRARCNSSRAVRWGVGWVGPSPAGRTWDQSSSFVITRQQLRTTPLSTWTLPTFSYSFFFLSTFFRCVVLSNSIIGLLRYFTILPLYCGYFSLPIKSFFHHPTLWLWGG